MRKYLKKEGKLAPNRRLYLVDKTRRDQTKQNLENYKEFVQPVLQNTMDPFPKQLVEQFLGDNPTEVTAPIIQ